MSSSRLDLRIFGVPKKDPGFIYIFHDHGRYKIGRSTDEAARIKAAKTWLPDMVVVGVKPFWNVSKIERNLHEGFSRDWYSGEWFQFSNEGDRDLLIEGFLQFSDTDRDRNSVDFIYWFNSVGMAEFVIERRLQCLTMSKFLRQESLSKKE